MKILILGVTGLVGSELLKRLIDSRRIESIISFVRRPAELKNEKVKEVVVNFDELESYCEEFQVDCVFCCLGTTIKKAKTKEAFRLVDHDYPLRAAKIAKSKSVKKFILVSAQGANPNSPIFYNRVKGEVERDIAELGIEEFISMRPSILLGEREEGRPMEKMGGWLLNRARPLFFGPFEKYRAVPAANVASSMLGLCLGEEKVFSGLEVKKF